MSEEEQPRIEFTHNSRPKAVAAEVRYVGGAYPYLWLGDGNGRYLGHLDVPKNLARRIRSLIRDLEAGE